MWDPATYLAFADHRARPFHDLLARVGAARPRRVVDVGCGPGNLTTALAERWPDAIVEALDSSPDMVAEARSRGIDASVDDARTWTPRRDTDVVVANAVLQWIPEHDEVLTRWASALPSGAWLAMQVPGNFADASHALTRDLAGTRRWRDTLGEARAFLQRGVLEPAGYAELLAGTGCAVDVWETTYLQRLHGDDPVLEWITGTALRPVRAALSDQDWAEFRAELAPMLRAAYPRGADGGTWLPFRRVFAVAVTP